LVQVAARHRVTSRTVSYNAAAVRAAGSRLPVSAPLITEATRGSGPGADHLGRVRIAATLGLPAPASAPVQEPGPVVGTVPAGHLTVARASARMLAAVGPLDLPTLASAVVRTRRFRARNPMSESGLAVALTTVGCTLTKDDRWHRQDGVVAPDRYQLIVTLATRELTRAEMIAILLAAGYRESSATGRMSSSHPLFQRTGPGWYRLVGDGDVPGWTGQLGQVSG
jgi:hypothetical protein